MRGREPLALLAVALAGTAAETAGSLDWTAVTVALIGLAGVITAAALARSARTKESTPAPAADLLHEWRDIVTNLREALDRETDRADRAEKQAEEALGQRNIALVELRKCQVHDHGDLT